MVHREHQFLPACHAWNYSVPTCPYTNACTIAFSRITYGGQVDKREVALACIREAWKHGINFFDTAEAYHAGAAEEMLGEAF